MADDMKSITGLWKNTSKGGTTYLSGSVTVSELVAALTELERESPHAKVMIFTNGYKEDGDNKPDYKMYLAPKESERGAFKRVSESELKNDNVPF